MGKNLKRRKIDKITFFSIGSKMVMIITVIVLMSLGSITALVSWLVREDLRIAAEENNFEINRRSAAEAEYTIEKTLSNSHTLMRTLAVLGIQSELVQDTTKFFFEQNPQVAVMIFSVPGQEDELLLNRRFFESREIDTFLAYYYYINSTSLLKRAAAGETMLLNVTPHFTIPVLALFFPGQNGGGAVLFSPENLNDSFGFGVNQSYLINDSGDILIHSDFEIMRSGVNVADRSFIREIQESTDRSRQALVETDFGFARNVNKANMSYILPKWEIIQPYWENAKHKIKTLFDSIERNEPEKDAQKETVSQFVAYTKLNIGGCTVITSIEYNKVFEGIAATTRRNIYLTIAVLFISIMLIWFFAKSISIPLRGLAYVARSIEGGIFNLNIKPKGKDEIGLLTDSFQKMCSALNVFGKFTNRDIAVRAMRGEIKPGGLPKNATIFFSDIRDFTSISENFTKVFGLEASDRIVHWLNNYLTCMVDCVEKTGGVVDKFIGDAVMAHWGTAYTAGSPQKDAYNCVYSALMMRKAVIEMNRKCRPGDAGNPVISIGCGINTGMVTAGQIGSDLRMEYTVIGDPVNLASRLESLNKPLGTDILITENTWELVKDSFITEEMPSVNVKGKEKPVRIFAVINIAGSDKAPRTLAEVRKFLGIQDSDISAVDVNKREKKYSIGGTGRREQK